MKHNKNKESFENNQQNKTQRPLGDTDVVPPSRFGFNRRTAMKSLDLAYQNGTIFTAEEGFGPVESAVLAPSVEASADLRKKVESAPEMFHLPRDKQLKEDLYEAEKQLSAEALMANIADKLSNYTSEEESGSVVFGLRESKQIQEGQPDIGTPRHWQGDLRSGIETHSIYMKARWSMNGQIVALGYNESNFFLPDGEVKSQTGFSEKFQAILDFNNDVVLYGEREDNNRSSVKRAAGGSMTTHIITSFLENPNTRIVQAGESDAVDN